MAGGGIMSSPYGRALGGAGEACVRGMRASARACAANTIAPVEAHIKLLKETANRPSLNGHYSFLDPGPIGSLYEAAIGWSTPSGELRGEEEYGERALWE